MSSGTQSPPLEATGSHIPMGVSSIDGTCSKPMKDTEQRAEYFSDAVRHDLKVQDGVPLKVVGTLHPTNDTQVKEQYANYGSESTERSVPAEEGKQKK